MKRDESYLKLQQQMNYQDQKKNGEAKRKLTEDIYRFKRELVVKVKKESKKLEKKKEKLLKRVQSEN